MGHKKFISIFLLIILLAGCGKQDVSVPDNPKQENGENVNTSDENKDSTEDENDGDENGNEDKDEESVFTGLTVSHITDHSAVFTVNVIDGYRYITEKGVIWSDDESLPESNRSSDKRDPEFFSYKGCIINLENDKDYYVRPYMIMNGDSVYGETFKFRTLSSMKDVKLTGKVTWRFSKELQDTDSDDVKDAYSRITVAMDSAVYVYNMYTNIVKDLTVEYNVNVPTADGSSRGHIRFGKGRTYMWVGTAMHEIAHTVGVGTSGKWKGMFDNSGFMTKNVRHEYTMLRTLDDNKLYPMLKAGGAHFWPYGINYRSEVNDERDLVKHALLVSAMKADGM